MADDPILYDLRERTYPHQRGDIFRSLQVFECWVCGACTNRIVMGGYPGYGVRAVCPHAAECWHHEIEEKVAWSRHPHPKPYQDALLAEIEAMRAAHASEAVHDIEGQPDFGLKRSVTNVRAYQQGPPCPHWT